MAATVYRIHREYIDIEYGYVIWIVDLFLVVIYRRYIAQCRLKSVGFTTSRIKESSEIKKKRQRDTTTRSAIGCPNI